MLIALTKPHTWSYSGLYMHLIQGADTRERVDAATVPALQMLPNILPGSPMILQSISCWQ